MRSAIAYIALLGLSTGFIALQPVSSGVYEWQKATVTKKAGVEQRTLLEGSTTDFTHLNVHATTLAAHQAPHPAHTHADEELIIIKEGELTVTIAGKTRTLGTNSVALMMPGDEHGFENKSDKPATYYVMRYESKAPVNRARGQQAGGSFWIDWKDVAFQPHDKGGIRRMFDRATAMTNRFEMHVTTLNQGLWSHAPHTHRAGEILIMVENTAQESIDGKLHQSKLGDVIFLESNVPHALQNTSNSSCTYFAFQFE